MTGHSFLERMARESRERVTRARSQESEAALLSRAMGTEPPPRLRLRGFDLIAELKRRSPAEGDLAAPTLDQPAQLTAYAAGGATAISVLTEPNEFKGSLEHLRSAAALMRDLGVPVMRKDFLTAPYQVLEARAAGAGGVLVIITMLTDEEAGELLACARDCGLFVLLEAFDAPDLARISRLCAPPRPTPAPTVLSGVNCRDLNTLAVRFERFASLAADLPPGIPAIAESGVNSPEQARQIASLGYAGALIGSALMRSAQPRQAVSELLAAGRLALSQSRACS